MSSRKNSGDHKYLFTETSGDSIDTGSVGGKNLLRTDDNGSPTLSATGITCDGIVDGLVFTTTNNPLTDVAADADITQAHSWYYVIEPLSAPSGLWYISGGATSAGSLLIYYDTVNATADRLQTTINRSGGGGTTMRMASPGTGSKYYVGFSISPEGHTSSIVISENGTTLFEHAPNTSQTLGAPTGKNLNKGMNVLSSSGAAPSIFTHGKISRMETWKSEYLTAGEHHQTAFDIFSLTVPTAPAATNSSDDLEADFVADFGTVNTITDEINTACAKMVDLDDGNSLISSSSHGDTVGSLAGATWEFRMKYVLGSATTRNAIAQYNNAGGASACMILSSRLSGNTTMQLTLFTGTSGSLTSNLYPNVQVADLVEGNEYVIHLVGDSSLSYNGTTKTARIYIDGVEVQYNNGGHLASGTYTGTPAAPEELTFGGAKAGTQSGVIGAAYFRFFNTALTPGQIHARLEAEEALEGTNPACPVAGGISLARQIILCDAGKPRTQ